MKTKKADSLAKAHAAARNGDVRRLLAADTGRPVTLHDMLTACYGQWPPRGLDVDWTAGGHPFAIHIETRRFSLREWLSRPLSTWHQRHHVLGDASFVDNRMRLNLKLVRESAGAGPELYQVLAHEGAHLLQYQAATLQALEESTPGSDLSHPGYAADHALQALLSRHPLRTGGLAAVFNRAASRDLAYITRGIEYQAHLHEVLVQGYALWGRLPATRDELWAALAALGVPLTPSVALHLRQCPAVTATFVPAGGPVSSAARSLALVHRNLDAAGRETLWRETLPRLYADLIEMLGDVPGRARFGLGDNTTLARLRWLYTRQPQNQKQARAAGKIPCP